MNGKRTRGRPGRNRPSNPRSQTYDSNGPDGKVRGTANQVFEKYQALARDMHSAGDRIGAENFSQHAEHYYRILSTMAQNDRSRQQANGPTQEGAVNRRGNSGHRKPESVQQVGAKSEPEVVLDKPEGKAAAPMEADSDLPSGDGTAPDGSGQEIAKS